MRKKDIIYLGIICGILMFWASTCSSKKESTGNAKDIIAYQDTVKFERSRSGKLMATNAALKISEKDARYYIDSLKGYLKDLHMKKPDVIVRTVTVLKIDSVPVPFKVELPCNDFVVKDSIREKWYNFNYTLTKRAFVFMDVRIPNKSETVIGEKKNGFLKRSEYSIVVVNSNPYMEVEKLAALTIKPKVKWYDKLWFKSCLFATGIFIGRISK